MIKKLVTILLIATISFTAISDSMINKHRKSIVNATIINYIMINDSKYLVQCELEDGNVYGFYSDTQYLDDEIVLIIQDGKVINAVI